MAELIRIVQMTETGQTVAQESASQSTNSNKEFLRNYLFTGDSCFPITPFKEDENEVND